MSTALLQHAIAYRALSAQLHREAERRLEREGRLHPPVIPEHCDRTAAFTLGSLAIALEHAAEDLEDQVSASLKRALR